MVIKWGFATEKRFGAVPQFGKPLQIFAHHGPFHEVLNLVIKWGFATEKRFRAGPKFGKPLQIIYTSLAF